MTAISTAPRNVQGERGERRDYLETFREFIEHLDRASRRRGKTAADENGRRGNKR